MRRWLNELPVNDRALFLVTVWMGFGLAIGFACAPPLWTSVPTAIGINVIAWLSPIADDRRWLGRAMCWVGWHGWGMRLRTGRYMVTGPIICETKKLCLRCRAEQTEWVRW